ncbi:protein kinase [Verrucomicrobiaceae bacterium N1E253]|uniref:Protein kinase n=1 Tax=Oceaniferula marina TaxID=2748318 RepID=A0A851GNK3_9BACT|nr:protein kinase [Oceaniferula marina]NWK56410.1 protein kinase [Oceaniferula marina]
MSNRYEITSLLEKDRLGDVYMALDVTLQRKVVFRKFESQSAESLPEHFASFTGKLCALQHPNLLTIYDIDHNDEGYYMVTQYVDSEALVDRLKRGSLSVTGVFNMASDLLDALHAIHSVGLIHGALRSDSVSRIDRVRGGHRYLVGDLGLDTLSAMLGGRDDVSSDLELSAPELLEGAKPNEQGDLFALGQLCYIAVAGGHPMSGNTVDEYIQAYQQGGMPDVKQYAPELQQDFADWIMRMVAADPADRPESAEAAMIGLHEITVNAPASTIPGMTQAVAEVAPPAVVPQSGIQAQAVAANQTQAMASEVPPEPSPGQAISPKSGGIKEKLMAMPKQTRVMMGAGAALLCLILVIGVSMLTRGNGDASDGGDGRERVMGDGPVFLLDASRLCGLKPDDTLPKVVLDGGEVLDWTLVTGAPVSSERLDHQDGTFLASLFTSGDYDQFQMPSALVRYEGNGMEHQPQGAMTDSVRGLANYGHGWQTMLRVPKKHQGPVLVTFYLIQDRCDYEFEVKLPGQDAPEKLRMTAGTPGVFKVPMVIRSPQAGGFYAIKVSAKSEDSSRDFSMGLQAIQIQKY